MTRVLIVEDDAAFRRRYAQMLAHDPAFEVVASVDSGGEGLAMLDLRKPDVLLIDLGLPDISGIEVIRHANQTLVGSSRVDLQACKLEYSIVSPK